MLEIAGDLTGRFFVSAETRIPLAEMLSGSVLSNRADDLRGRSVLIATSDNVLTAAALIELDGVAGRLVLCPATLPPEQLPFVLDTAGIDAVVSDKPPSAAMRQRSLFFVPCCPNIEAATCRRTVSTETEWVLLTSGTTGRPKLVSHTLASLTGAIEPGRDNCDPIVWSPLFDLRRFGGIQVFFRAVVSGSSLVLSSSSESIADFLSRMSSFGATHICGTPSQWRSVLMSPTAGGLKPRYIRLGGEIADDGILAGLQSRFPHTEIVHSFASTEAGVAFVVKDGHAGFPSSMLDETPHVEMKIRNQTLCIRSGRTAQRYLGNGALPLKDADGFVDTGDLIESRDGRCLFVGRLDGLINVGGLKVSPEEVEAVINRHPDVHMSLVRAKKNRVTGAIVVADLVLRDAGLFGARNKDAVRREILLSCGRLLARHKVPATINFVSTLPVAPSGKILRS
jgi:acyl-CoA synthetase (AMP-forming)/AMP-acid ligase II